MARRSKTARQSSPTIVSRRLAYVLTKRRKRERGEDGWFESIEGAVEGRIEAEERRE